MRKDTYKNLKTINLAAQVKKLLSKEKLHCLIFGNFGAMNLGDEAILAGQLQELQKIKNIDCVVVSRNPKEVLRLHGIKSVSIYDLVGISKQLIRSNVVIVGGGGLICKADRLVVGILYQFYMLYLYILLPKLLRKKIFATGIGIYNNSNPAILYVARLLLKQVDLLTVRDKHSYNYLESKNIKSILFKDNSFLMNLFPKENIKKMSFFKNKLNNNYKNIGLALTKPTGKKAENILMSKLSDFVNKNYKQSVFWFYSCDFQKGYENDYLFSKKVHKYFQKKYGREFKAHFVPTDLSPKIFFSSFRLMDAFFTMRLHASIFAYRSNIKFMGISYDKKCASFLEQIGKAPIELRDLSTQRNFGFLNRILFRIFVYLRRFIYISIGLLDSFGSGNSVFVVSYHSVAKDNWRFSIDPEEIKKQITFLKSKYNIISLNTLEQHIKGKMQITKPSVVVTFDDGYKDILQLKDFFRQNNIKPAIFILSQQKKVNYKELGTERKFLNRKELLLLKDDGWEIGSHSNTHSNLQALSLKELREEIVDSKHLLESMLNTRIKYFAYPRGKYTREILDLVKKAGYDLGLTMDDGFISQKTNPLRVPRIGIDRTHSFLEFKSLYSINNINMRWLVKQSFIGRFI